MRTRRRRKSSAVEGEGVGRVGGIERVRGHGSYGIALTFDLIPFQLFPRPRTDPYQSYLELAPTSCPTPLRDFAVRPRCRFVSFQFVARKKKKEKKRSSSFCFSYSPFPPSPPPGVYQVSLTRNERL